MKVFKRSMALLLCLAMTLGLFAGLTLTASAATVTDTLTASDFVATGTSYKSFSGVSDNSDAVYAGSTAKNGTSIQIKSGTVGIYTTTSGGSLTSVEISRPSTGSGTITVYTNDSSTSSASGTNRGTVAVSQTKTIDCGGAKHVTIAASGASYITTIKFNWSTGPSYTLTASSNGHGTVGTPANGTVSCTPESGYYLSGASVTAGCGLTVSVSGNTISYTGTQTKNAVITATFSAKTAATLTYSENGTTHSASIGTKYVGDEVTLSAPATSTLDGGYEFVGWLPSTYAESDTKPTGLLEEGDSYTLSAASNTLYAVYAIKSGSGSGSGGYKLVESALSDYSGEYLIVYNNTNALNTHYGNQNANTYGTYTNISSYYSSSDKTIASNATTDALAYTAAKTTNGYSLKSKNNEYLGTTSTSSTGSQLRWDTTFTAKQDEWTLAPGSIVSAKTTTLAIRWNTGSPRFAIYGTSNQSAIQLFKKEAGASYSNYTTTVNLEANYYTLTYGVNPADSGSIACDVANNGRVEEGTDVTLTATAAEHFTFKDWTVTGTDEYAADGNEIIVTMTDDVNVVANFEAEPTYTVTIVSVAGGSMTASKTEDIFAGETITLTATPDEHYTFNGWQCTAGDATISGNTFTMPAADVIITGTFTEDAKYTVSYYSADGTLEGSEQVYSGEKPANVPTIAAPAGFTFLGWYGDTYDGKTAPTMVNPANETISADKSFHALYGEGSGSGSANEFEYTTDISNGDYIIGYYSYGDLLAFDSDGIDTWLYGQNVSPSSNKITTTDTSIIWTLTGDASGFTLKNKKTGDYLTSSGTGGGSIYLSSSGTTYTASASGNNYVVYNGNSDASIRYNSSGYRMYDNTTTGQRYLSFYKASASYENYTTNPVLTKIHVTWMNGSEEFDSTTVDYDVQITAPEGEPTKTDAEMEYYAFVGWSEEEGGTVITNFPTSSATLGDKTYYAVYNTLSKLTVTWNNYDNSPLATEYYKSGETPSFKGNEPTKPADASFYYTFSGWDPTVSPVTAAITYTATFTQHDRFEMSASLTKNPIKVGKYGQVNATLTDAGVATSAFTPTYTVADTSIATVDANGQITAKAIGTTTITVTYPDACDSNGDPLTKTLTLQVIENTSAGGYTLITEDMADWSGDYIFAGRKSGRMVDLNNLMIMTPGYDVTVEVGADRTPTHFDAVLEDGGSEKIDNVSVRTGVGAAQNNASWLDLTISGTEATGTILSAYKPNDPDTITMSSTGKNNAGSYMVLDYIDEIDDSYAFTIEQIDDINGYYTIRIKGTNYYLANDNNTDKGNNSLGFAFAVGDSTAPLWKIKMYEGTATTEGYTPPVVSITSVYNPNRAIFFNPNGWDQSAAYDSAETARFRTYGSASTGAEGRVGGTVLGGGANYSLYLYGNPNPFKAQIYYKGDQITIAESGKVNANAATAQLTSALTPDIINYPSWELVGDPVWTITERSSGNNFDIDSETGLITTNASSVGSYALVQVAYTVHDKVNDKNHIVSTIAKVDVIAADTTYSTVIYEKYSGEDTEVQYTIPNSMTELPLAAYVVNDTTNDNSKTGNVVQGGTMSWTITSTSTSMFGTFSIDANGVLHMSNVTKDSIVTVKVTGATGDNTAATAATYKVYVKAASYEVKIEKTPESAGTYDADSDTLTIPGSASAAQLTYSVKDGNGNGPGTTFTIAGYAWTISGEDCDARITSDGVLDFSEMDRSVDHTITVVVSRIAATDLTTGAIASGLTDTITLVIEKQVIVEGLDAIDDVVVVDYALPVTFNVLTNDVYNVEVTASVEDTLPTGVTDNGGGSFTFTPNGWLTTEQTFEYTLSGTVDGASTSDTATVTLKPADAVYYEDTYSDIFTYTGTWEDLEDGDPVTEQTSSLDTADIFEYDASREAYAMYSGGTAKMTTVTKGNASRPSVSFTFAGTGFDVISATTNNGGAVLMTITGAGNSAVKDPVTGRNLNAIYDNFRGYVYCEEEYSRYTLDQVRRCDADGRSNPTGDYYWDNDNKEAVQPVKGNWYDLKYGDTIGTGEEGAAGVDGINLYDGYSYEDAEEFFEAYLDPAGSFIIKEHRSHWKPYEKDSAEADSYNTNFYQIPIMKITGLPYGTYTVTLTPTYSSAYDRAGDNSYDFIFDGIRIHNPVADRAAEYKYINFSDIVDANGFGSGEIIACDHVDTGRTDWAFYSRATNTSSPTTNNRGSFVRCCTYCGAVTDTAYFHVNVSAVGNVYTIGVDGYNGLPATTLLHYTLTADEGEAQADIQAILNTWQGKLTEYWSSNSRAVMTCMNNSGSVIANGQGTSYTTLQLKDPATQVIYASAIHSPMITVEEDTSHHHVWGAWVHNEDTTDSSTHTRTCSADGCDVGTQTEDCVFTDKVTTAPTYTTTGVRTYTCSGCGYQYTETIPVLTGYTATFHVPEGAETPAAQTGDTVTMPAAVAAPAVWNAQTYQFVGWVANTVSDTTTEQTTIYRSGSDYPLTANTDYYALYTYDQSGAGSGLTKMTADDDLYDGDNIVIVAENTNIALYQDDESRSSYIDTYTFDPDTAASDPKNYLTLTATDGGFYLGDDDNGYLYNSGNNLYVGTTKAVWEIYAYEEDDTFSIETDSRYLSYRDDSTYKLWRMGGADYGTNGIFYFDLYKLGSVETYYTTELAKACTHPAQHPVVTPATCTAAGSTDMVCDVCGKTVSSEPIAALNHNFIYTDNEDDATHTVTCSRCDYSEVEDHNFENGECTLCGAEAPAASGFVKVTSEPTSWAGTYLLVYESGSTGNVWTGVDSKNCTVSASISNNTIASQPAGAVTLTIEAVSGGYSIKVNGGTNDGKYIYGTNNTNKTNFGTSASACTLSYTDGGTMIVSNTSVMRYNSNDTWFRFYKSSTYTGQKAVQLYKLQGSAPRSATRSIVATGDYNGIAIIDGKGNTTSSADHAAYGPEHGVYLAPGQGIVFYLTSDVTDITYQDLQIGAKAVNGTATSIDVASISNGTEYSGVKYLLESKAIASATEMYYELDGSQVSWKDGTSSIIVVYNSGSGVLDVTNLRYSTANGNTLTMHINEAATKKASKMIQIVYGEPVTDPDPIEPTDLDLNFASAELVLNSDIAINFNVDKAVMDSAEGVYAVFTKALYNEAGEITGSVEAIVNEAIYNEETGKYSFRFTGINPAEMGSAVTAQLFGCRDGELISGKEISYSVLTYINNMYGKLDNAEFRTLLADLAAYGAAAQNYVGYNTANLVTDATVEGLDAYATKAAPELNNATAISGSGAVKFTGAYLSLRERVTVCYTIDASEFEGNAADLELRIFDGKTLLGTAAFNEVNGKYVASFSGLNALQMHTVLTAEVYDGDECVSTTLDYSIESYAASKAAGSDTLADLVNAMMNFGISAETYFN